MSRYIYRYKSSAVKTAGLFVYRVLFLLLLQPAAPAKVACRSAGTPGIISQPGTAKQKKRSHDPKDGRGATLLRIRVVPSQPLIPCLCPKTHSGQIAGIDLNRTV